MTRFKAISAAQAHFDAGEFQEVLARRIAIPTESQNPERAADLERYLVDEMVPEFSSMGFTCSILDNPKGGISGQLQLKNKHYGPFLFAERLEDKALPTVLGYGHGDVIRGMDDAWSEGLSPWQLVPRNGRWYGRGVVDNKGQHSVNLAAVKAVLSTRGRLGFNAKYIIEMGEETGSPGLRELCQQNAGVFSADLLLASDGPRLSAVRPTIFLGARGGFTFDMTINAREGGHHSGNWGGLLSNPGIELAHAIACLVGPTGQIRVPGLVPDGIPKAVKDALVDCAFEPGADDPVIEPWWGEPGLSAAEKVFGWCNLEVLAFTCGNPQAPVNAIPPHATARMQLRFVVGVEPDQFMGLIRAFLDRHGFARVHLSASREEMFRATRLDPDNAWVRWAAASIQQSTGIKPAILPNLGGSLPNDIFAEVLGLPTIWVPHSYPGCSQHAPDEHVPVNILREGLAMMAGLYWDMGEMPAAGPT